MVTAPLIQAELGLTQRGAQQVGLRLMRAKLFDRLRRGKYRLTPLGRSVLQEIAEGKAPDRYKVREEIVRALAAGEHARKAAA